MKVYPTFASRNFVSGQQIKFTVYKYNGQIVFQGNGKEIGNTGVYYIELKMNLFWRLINETLLIIAEESNGNWKSAKVLNGKNII